MKTMIAIALLAVSLTACKRVEPGATVAVNGNGNSVLAVTAAADEVDRVPSPTENHVIYVIDYNSKGLRCAIASTDYSYDIALSCVPLHHAKAGAY